MLWLPGMLGLRAPIDGRAPMGVTAPRDVRAAMDARDPRDVRAPSEVTTRREQWGAESSFCLFAPANPFCGGFESFSTRHCLVWWVRLG